MAEEMKMISFDDFQDKYIGKIGTPGRDAFEKEVEDFWNTQRVFCKFLR